MNAHPRVFIVEDEALIAMELRDRLTRLGHDVCGVAAHGERALEQIPPAGPDLVLMDVCLAGRMDGIETACRLRTACDAPVVFLTAFSDAELLSRAADARPFGYLVKPFDERELNATILMALAKHRLDRAARAAHNQLEERVRERTAELERANARLRDRELLLSGINTNLVGAAVYRLVFDPAGRMRCTYLSPNAAALLGAPTDPLLEQPERFFDLVTAEDLPRVRASIAETLRTGANDVVEARLRHADGGVRWFQFRSRLVERLPDGSQVRDGVVTDVTAAKETEQALRESGDQLARLNAGLEEEARRRAAALLRSEQRYSDLGERINDAVVRDDIAGRLVYANRRFREWFGELDRPAGGAALEDHAAPKWRAALRDRHDRLVRGEAVPDRFEYEGVRSDGSRVWLEAHVTPVAEDGRTVGTQAVLRDVTARKRTETVLRFLSTELARLTGPEFFTAVARQLAAVLGAEVGFVAELLPHTSPPRVRTLGLCVEGAPQPEHERALTGSPCEAVLHRDAVLYPDRVQEQFPNEHGLAALGARGYAAVALLDRSGKPLGHLGVVSRGPLRDAEEIEPVLQLFAVRVGAEIERQHGARMFHNLFEFAPDAIVMTDPQGTIRLANRQAEELFGWPRAELLGRRAETLLVPEHRDRHVLNRARHSGTDTPLPVGPKTPDLRALRKDGTVFPIEVRTAPLEVDGVWVTAAAVRDVTERHRLERQINRAHRLEAIGTLAGGIAHDLNNALAPITMALQTLKHSCPDQSELLDVLEAGAARAAGMVRQLLTFAKGGEENARITVSARAVVTEVEKIVHSTFPKNIALTVAIPPGLPALLANPTQLHQVLLNMCVNARDAMPAGGALALSAEAAELDQAAADALAEFGARPGSYVVLKIADTGVGIPAEVAEHIFEPFYTTKGADTGTGLGLFSALGIVKSHGGFIRVTSALGQGTTFAVYLPTSSDPSRSGALPRAEAPVRGAGQTVLVVDDEAPIRQLVSLLLSRAGFAVRTAANGAAALTEAAALGDQLAAIVTDFHMPGVSGAELVAELRRERPHVPIVVASGLLGAAELSELRALGVEHTLNKPYSQGQLLKVLNTVLAAAPAH
ncbi:PAS domain S-box protein [Gemmata sp. JC717]|uniref:hybrid sensor histidine kinase/response regulator n=1 Tax=Gemmata algarum TaxID=2975278 RepID=UPI0021BAE66D|nr:PAS domain S-box protein [Gemmata algarum]MDY3553311.1 PAS domain S-box protein [Gemmata algarum]